MKKLSLPCFNPRDPYRSGKDEETYGRRLYALAESTFRHALHNKLDFMYWDRDPRTGQKLKITNPIRLVVGGELKSKQLIQFLNIYISIRFYGCFENCS